MTIAQRWMGKISIQKTSTPVLFTVVFLSLLILKVLSSHGWEPRVFILERPKDIPTGQTWGVGYDGRFSYALAVHPWGSVEDLDQPAYRYQRILFPLLARALSFGRPGLVPWAMLVLNLVSAAALCAALSEHLKARGASPWLALVFILSLGFLITIRMDLLEPMALALALWGWLAYHRRRNNSAVLLFAFAGLTKEVALVFPVGLALWEGLNRKWKDSLVLVAGSTAPYIAWYIYLYLWLGSSETQIAQSSLTFPFSGLRLIGDPVSSVVAGLWVLAPAVFSFLLAARDCLLNPAKPYSSDALLVVAQVFLIATMPALTWADPLAILRTGLGFLAVSLVWLASRHPRALPYATALWLPSGFVLFIVPGLL